MPLGSRQLMVADRPPHVERLQPRVYWTDGLRHEVGRALAFVMVAASCDLVGRWEMAGFIDLP